MTSCVNEPGNARAIWMLLVATACWGFSFPAMKTLGFIQADILPGSSSWFISSLSIVVRFGGAAVVLLLWSRGDWRRITRLEFVEGLGLGLFGGVGLIFQMDGLAHTSASVSAFLTQFYCLLIPLWVAWREKKWPSGWVLMSCVMVIAGVAVLSGFDWRTMRLGRGEWETLIASTIFTGQILWLQRPIFAGNNVDRFTMVMFGVIALSAIPIALLTAGRPSDFWRAYASGPALGVMGMMIVISTLGAYLLMNHWQPSLSATHAGLIYCGEPLFASLFALVLPAWFSGWARVNYPNENLGRDLLIGGGLVTLANVLIQLQPEKLLGKRDR